MSFFDPYVSMDHHDNNDTNDDLCSCCESIEDELPFAIVDTTHQQQQQQQPTTIFSLQQLSSPLTATAVPNKMTTNLLSPGASQETQTTLGSSILYFSPTQSATTPIAESTEQQQQLNDFDDADAAASLLAESPMLGRSSHFMERSAGGQQQSNRSPRDFSMDISGLLQDADNDRTPSIPTLHRSVLNSGAAAAVAVLPPRMTTKSGLLLGIFNTAPPDSSLPAQSTSTSRIFQRRGIETVRIDRDTYEVSMHLYSTTTTTDVMDIIGNPDLLRLWCEPVRTLVVTRSSEGARTATNNHRQTACRNREYDGEWVEATTSALTSGHRQIHTTAIYQLGQYIWNHLGFPSYGKITMFVERQRGQVGLTMGPFAGDVTAYHSIAVVAKQGEDTIRIVDRVRIAADDEEHAVTSCCCGIWNAMQKCFMPLLDGHIDQSIASMTRLRVMIENGQNALSDYDAPPDLIVEGEDDGGVSRIPLLS